MSGWSQEFQKIYWGKQMTKQNPDVICDDLSYLDENFCTKSPCRKSPFFQFYHKEKVYDWYKIIKMPEKLTELTQEELSLVKMSLDTENNDEGLKRE